MTTTQWISWVMLLTPSLWFVMVADFKPASLRGFFSLYLIVAIVLWVCGHPR